MTLKKITINMGAGGKDMHELINRIVLSRLSNNILDKLDDSAILANREGRRIAVTTDSYVVNPLFFEGGDIGRLCVSGTVNDLSTSGAGADSLTLSFIIEEGFELCRLETIVDSIAAAAAEAQVMIVTGDTKVVEKGKADGLYINTAAIGFIEDDVNISSHNAADKDIVVVTGTIGDHEVAIMKARGMLPFEINVESDVAPLNKKIEKLLSVTKNINVIKDPTRGGLASCLMEISDHSKCEIVINEENIPVSDQVKAVCELTGFDPLYMANEGKFVIVCPETEFKNITGVFPDSAVIGRLNGSGKSRLLLNTTAGGIRRLGMLETLQLPRIC